MRVVELFFDLSSPYSYLAATQIEALAARHQAEVRWRPMVLGAVFKAAGNASPATVAAKVQHMMADLGRWARTYGVPFKMSSWFPANTIPAMRMVLLADEVGRAGVCALAGFTAMWVEDRDLSSEAELRRLAEVAGLDPSAALARIQTPELKDRLRASTDEAIRRGAFGAPTIFVGDEMFWGNDRLHFVEEALSELPG